MTKRIRLLAVLLLRRHSLLLIRDKFVVGLSLGAQALNCIHHVGLLGEHGISKLLRPIKFAIHHVQDAWRCHE